MVIRPPQPPKVLGLQALEQDIKKLKADLQASRQVEQELRSQISSLSSTERGIRSEMGQLRQENELLQNKGFGDTVNKHPELERKGYRRLQQNCIREKFKPSLSTLYLSFTGAGPIRGSLVGLKFFQCVLEH
ncbi:Macoilin [Plecturocebus cupreus]